MSPIEVVLVFVGIPAVVVATVFGLVYGLSTRQSKNRSLPILGRPAAAPPARRTGDDAR